MNLSARDAALHLMAGPLSVSRLVENLRWFFAWDTETLDPGVTTMLRTWGRMAGGSGITPAPSYRNFSGIKPSDRRSRHVSPNSNGRNR